VRIWLSVKPNFAARKRHQPARVSPPIMIGLPFSAEKLSLPMRGCASRIDGSFWKIAAIATKGRFCWANSIARPPPRLKSSRPAIMSCIWFTCGPP
jgi:hypothetical protein